MASIRERNGKFNVIYSYTNEKGERKQKWETYETKAEAKRRKKEIEYKNGKPVEKTHNLFSGYLLVQMIMTDEAWYVVRNTPGVTGFIGSSGKGAKPFPVAQEEVDAVLRRLGRQDVNVQVDFEVGDRVEITNGAFKNSEGVIEAMDEEKKEATVLLILFGRETPTEIPYMDLKKVD